MAAEHIVVGLDIGTTKVCTLVAEVGGDEDNIRVIGVGLEPSRGMHRGTVVDVALAAEAVRASKRQAERTSGYEIGRAYVSVAGKHIASLNSRGITGLNPNKGAVTQEDIERALDAARAVALPHNREVLHVIPRTFTVDGQEGIRNPLGLHAYRLEVEAHIITAASSTLRNLEKCVSDAGLGVDRFVLNPLASAELVLTEAERESGVVVVDIGGGTTDLAVFIDGTVWHTAVIEIGGNLITSDIAHVLHLPTEEAERIKVEYGNADPDTVNPDEWITVQPFGEDQPTQILRYDLARIIEARVDEIFLYVIQELKRSGYDGLLPAGAVLTGGSAALKNIRSSASKVMHLPVRVGQPEGLTGLVDRLKSPAYATSAGLLSFARHLDTSATGVRTRPRRPRGDRPDLGKALGDIFGRLLPDE
ncbi:MAG TPA: cell division protein FtsA [Chloroflexi bacterium]|nr:cell division protein FtsA [Chloroflexota bacterium]